MKRFSRLEYQRVVCVYVCKMEGFLLLYKRKSSGFAMDLVLL